MSILDVPMDDNDAGAPTVRAYILMLGREVWRENEGFSGKRPFGNSGWDWDIHAALAKAGVVVGAPDEDGFWDLTDEERRRSDRLVTEAIDAWLAELPPSHPVSGTAETPTQH